ncbi:DUF1286 domain-containing protein [Saccharolobus sp. A20]|uniref:DUF1286 domain-containing protein n=1 Tax=Saccharolobus sp. A20 TaxID=1891280 RepID=UPI000ACE17B9|nr:DUF1286 domain-containing protein [Sulfolobus sp. A20]
MGVLSIIPIIVLLFLSDRLSLKLYLIINGIIVGPSHMLLDLFTERGIYVKKNGKWKRFALSHYKL